MDDPRNAPIRREDRRPHLVSALRRTPNSTITKLFQELNATQPELFRTERDVENTLHHYAGDRDDSSPQVLFECDKSARPNLWRLRDGEERHGLSQAPDVAAMPDHFVRGGSGIRYWLIAPYAATSHAVFEAAWAYDRRHGTIAIGWSELGDISSLGQTELREAYQRAFPGQTSAQACNMLWRFLHEINPGDKVIARRGRRFMIGIGTVTGPPFYDERMALERVPSGRDWPSRGDWPCPNFMPVVWESTAEVDLEASVFPMHTVSEVSAETFRSLAETIPARKAPMPEQAESERFPLLAAYGFMESHALKNEAKSIQQSQGRLGSYNSTIRRGRVIVELERTNLLHEFFESEWPVGLTERGRREIESCKRVYERFLAQSPVAENPEASKDSAIAGTSAQINASSDSSLVLDAHDGEIVADVAAEDDVRKPTQRTQDDLRPPGLLDLVLDFWSAVFDIAAHIMFPQTSRRSTPKSNTSEAAQQETPGAIKSGTTAHAGAASEITPASNCAPVLTDVGGEGLPAPATTDRTHEPLAPPAPSDDVGLPSGTAADSDEPLTVKGDEELVVQPESAPSAEPSFPACPREPYSPSPPPAAADPVKPKDDAGDPSYEVEAGNTPFRDPGLLLPAPSSRGTFIAPELRGGAPRGPRAISPSRPTTTMGERPQLVCVRRGAGFHIGFEGAPVCHAGSANALDRDHGLQRIVDLEGAYSWQEGDRPPEAIRLPNVLVFQLSASAERGWQVSRAGVGTNLLVAPNTCELRPTEGVSVVFRPAVGIAGHQAWELQVEEAATAISFSSTSGQIDVPVERLEIAYDRPPIGESNQQIPVFGPGPPEISVRDRRPLDCLVIGREDLTGDRKRERVDPGDDLSERISSVLRIGGFGWYFVRVYGQNDNGAPTLESSTSFWYAPGLSSQTASASDPMPQHGTYEEIEIDIVHDRTVTCIDAKSLGNGRGMPHVLEINATGSGSLVRVPGAIVCDGVEAMLRSSEGPTLTLRIPVVRYWWAVTDDSAPPSEWVCTQVEVSPSKFRAESPSRLHVRLPLWSPPRALEVQFRDAPVHGLKWLRGAGTATFRLGDLDGDMRSLKTAACDLFIIATDGAGEEDHAIALRMVPAFACRLCDDGYDNLLDADGHVRDTHMNDLRPRITDYARIARAFNEQYGGERLPSKIHKCTLCTEYYPVDDWQAKDGLGVRHMMTCPNLPKGGGSSASFEVIKDIDRIRASSAKHLIERAGDAFACKWCSERVTFGQNAAEDHIFSDHRRLLYDAH